MPSPGPFVARLLTVAAAAASLCVPMSPAMADDIRASEWPLNAQHYQADRIWEISKGGHVTVAVVDSGVAASHPDLSGQVIAGTSLLGDGGDGRTDTSGDSHGTAIAGIIAGTGGAQGTGMTGLAPEAEILPVRVATDGEVLPSLLARGIVWASDHGAQVINISMGSPHPDPLLRQAVTYALGKDIVLVSSAGNQGEGENLPMYPAAFPGVLSVSGVDETGAFWTPSESGQGITIAAPATGIYSTSDQGRYVHSDGTSYAAAYVSAAAALVRSRDPHLTAGQTIRRLITTTTDHHERPGPRLGYGILNPLAALTSSADPGDAENPLLKATTASPAIPENSTAVIAAVIAVPTVAFAAAVAIFVRRRRHDHASSDQRPAAGAGSNRLKSRRRPHPKTGQSSQQATARARNRSSARTR
ncbi:type VII secretion-associated serine protease mycosin [Kitasatospora sp. NPDC057223]|uniref:type VII secretion-associated serine protease mycosin n=1 Tax=Kitasatospora sp. NPDC057223 TaxID=3346055 RepID=UPI003642FC8B